MFQENISSRLLDLIEISGEDASFTDSVDWYLDAEEEAYVYHIKYENKEGASLTAESSYTDWYYRYGATEEDTAITLPTLTKLGYTFGGWYTDENCTESNKKESIATTDAQHFTLYAKWTAAK